MVKQKTIEVATDQRESLIDITREVALFVQESAIKNGQLTLFVPHTTAGVTINENADPDVETDIIYALNKTFPNLKAFRHMEGNSDAHIKSSLIGNTQTVFIDGGKMQLGTWQGLYFCEFDGPRKRKLNLQIIGE